MHHYFNWKTALRICVEIGIIWATYLFMMSATGVEKTEAIYREQKDVMAAVTSITYPNGNKHVAYSFKDNGRTYAGMAVVIEKNYSKSKKIKPGDKLKIYYQASDPNNSEFHGGLTPERSLSARRSYTFCLCLFILFASFMAEISYFFQIGGFKKK